MRPSRAMRGLLGVLLLAAALPLGAGAEGEVVQTVRVEGLRTVSETYVLSRIRTAAGTPLDESVMGADIARLYQTGYFAEVRVRREEAAGGIGLVIELVENPLVVGVQFRGNRLLSEKKLLGMMRTRLKEGESRYLGRADLDFDRQAVEEGYREKAFLFARVRPTFAPAEGGELLVFEIEEGKAVPVRGVRIHGNRAFTDRKLKRKAPILTKKKLWFFRSGTVDLHVMEEDVRRIRDYYAAHGWLDARVSLAQQADLAKGRTDVRFDVVEGERYAVGTVALQGNTLLAAEDLLPKFRTRSGRAYSLEEVDHDLEKIREEYGNLGRIVARADPRYRYDKAGRRVDITFDIEEGPEIRVGRIEVEGNGKTQDKVARRQMLLHPGDRFNYAKLKKSLKKIHALRYFDEIHPRFDEVEDPGVRDIALEVKEAKTGRFNYGAGFSDEAGLFGVVRVTQSNFDSADLRGFPANAWKFFVGDAYVGGGQQFSMSATPGQRLSSYDIAYWEPWLYDRPIGFGANVFLRTRILPDFDRRDQGASVTLSRRFGENWTLGNTTSFYSVRVSNVALDAPQSLRDSEGTVRVRALSPFLRWDTRDDPYTPSSGQTNQVTFEYAGAPIFDGVDYWRLSEEYQHFWTLAQNEDEERKHVLSFGARAGVVDSHDGTGELPVFLQYFAGGSGTVRGFRYASIGPKDGDIVTGGRFLLVNNLEYTYPIYEEILRGAVFVDRGKVAPSIGDGDRYARFRTGAGVGLRVHIPGMSPVPIALDLAWPVEKQDGDRTRMFTFSFGTVF